MSDTRVTLAQLTKALGTLLTGMSMLGFVLFTMSGCGDDDPMQSAQAQVKLRADAVDPPQSIDVSYWLGSHQEMRTNVEPGELIDLGPVDVGTVVRLRVTNAHDAGRVRANILIDDCFRASTDCSEPGCVTTAQYTTAIETCVNF